MRGKVFVILFMTVTLAVAIFFGTRMHQSFYTAPPAEQAPRGQSLPDQPAPGQPGTR